MRWTIAIVAASLVFSTGSTAQDPDKAKLQKENEQLKSVVKFLMQRVAPEVQEEARKMAPDILGKASMIETNQRHAVLAISSLGPTQVTFRTSDSDGNSINDFWVRDLSGLYRITAGGLSIKLIEEALAKADASPAPKGDGVGAPLADKPVPYRGYLFAAMKEFEDPRGKFNKYDGGSGRNFDRFGFCAYPAKHKESGLVTFISGEFGTVHWKDTGGKPVERMPMDAAGEGWKPVDRDPPPAPEEAAGVGPGGAINEALKVRCKENLMNFARQLEMFRRNHGGNNYELPSGTGRAFFKPMLDTVLEGDLRSIVTCPVAGKEAGVVTYRGPKKDINRAANYKSRDVIVCDGASSHPDGTIHGLTKGYQVVELRKGTPEYDQALATTTEE